MPVWICATRGNHYPDQESPPRECLICSDERQWVPSSGQRWTTGGQAARYIEFLRGDAHVE